ncbi:uncharacterized [Tachysurus ichikawai]
MAWCDMAYPPPCVACPALLLFMWHGPSSSPCGMALPPPPCVVWPLLLLFTWRSVARPSLLLLVWPGLASCGHTDDRCGSSCAVAGLIHVISTIHRNTDAA